MVHPVVALSVTNGVAKPLEYPMMFHNADLVVLTKIDLLPHLAAASLAELRVNLARVTPTASVLQLSATTAAGVTGLVRWPETHRERVRRPCA